MQQDFNFIQIAVRVAFSVAMTFAVAAGAFFMIRYLAA
jgi:hypothetical protein